MQIYNSSFLVIVFLSLIAYPPIPVGLLHLPFVRYYIKTTFRDLVFSSFDIRVTLLYRFKPRNIFFWRVSSHYLAAGTRCCSQNYLLGQIIWVTWEDVRFHNNVCLLQRQFDFLFPVLLWNDQLKFAYHE